MSFVFGSVAPLVDAEPVFQVVGELAVVPEQEVSSHAAELLVEGI